jgi:polyisoprenyl-phosphate glycosyltransferase
VEEHNNTEEEGGRVLKLTVVIPCYNEERVLERFYEEVSNLLHHEAYLYELIFVNDGSKDHTKDILVQLAEQDSKVVYVSFSKNFGKEAAMLAGLSYSTGDAVVIMDADLQHPPELIPKMVKKYEEGFDQVIAKRNRKGDSKTRSFASVLYYKMINNLIDVELENGIGDFRLLSRRAVDAILSLKEYNRFSKGLFSWIGFKESVISYENVVRDEGESKWTFPKLLNYGIDGVISFNDKPLRLSIYLGLTITVLDVVYVLIMLFQIIFKGIDVPGYFTTISAILLLGGIQLIFLGVIGEYIGRIYYETKRRPHFIVEDHNVQPRGIHKYEETH